MALRLRVVSEHSTRLGPQATKVFGVHGGTIGRSSDNEWILPDPERYLSGKHARVDFRGGTYVLVDTSSNGTYVNGAQVPLGKYHDYELKDGDYIRVGEYELLVNIDKSNDFPPDESAIVAYDGASLSAAAHISTANDLGAELDLSALLQTTDQPPPATGVRRAVSAPGIAVPSGGAPGGVAPQVAAPHDAYGQTLPSLEDEGPTPWHLLTRPLKVDVPGGGPAGPAPTGSVPVGAAPAAPATPGPTPAGTAASGATARVETARAPDSGAAGSGPPSISGRSFSGTLYAGDFDAGLSAFCRGAGIELQSLNSDARSTALQLAGQLLRESILGLMDLNHGSHEFRNRFRISAPPVEAAESPLNFSKGIDEALVRLLNNLSTRAGSVEAVRANFCELKAQNTATMTAMRAAFEEFLQRVDPKDLEERFEKAGKRGVFGASNKSKYWELYAQMYASVAQRPDDGFPHLYTEAFAKAFEAKLRTLVPPRRSGISDRRASDRGIGSDRRGSDHSMGSDRSDEAEPGAQAVGEL
jgi:type VI secretion system protein